VLSNRNQPGFEKVDWFYHRDAEQAAKFVHITTKSGHVIKLTGNHLLPLAPCQIAKSIIDNDHSKLSIDRFTHSFAKFAQKANVGDCVLSIDNEKSIIVVDEITKIDSDQPAIGIFSPITQSGSILVNGVHASCYSTVENHLLQKTLHSFVLNVSKSINTLVKYSKSIVGVFYDFGSQIIDDDDDFDRDVPRSLRYMLEVARVVLPPKF